MEHKIYKSQVVLNNSEVMCSILDVASAEFDKQKIGDHKTWSYGKYNVFGLTSPTQCFYDLFIELNKMCYDYTGADKLWMQAWMNSDPDHDPLIRHNHKWPWHGYIAIRPHKTRTVFDNFEIVNEVGNVYMGPGLLHHKVVVDEPYDTPRYSIGFDLNHERLRMSENIGLIPYPRLL